MNRTRAVLLTTIMLTGALAGCMADETSDLDARISELEQSNIELNEDLVTAQNENAQLQSATAVGTVYLAHDPALTGSVLRRGEGLSLIHI